jgi:hypothetical protein
MVVTELKRASDGFDETPVVFEAMMACCSAVSKFGAGFVRAVMVPLPSLVRSIPLTSAYAKTMSSIT